MDEIVISGIAMIEFVHRNAAITSEVLGAAGDIGESASGDGGGGGGDGGGGAAV